MSRLRKYERWYQSAFKALSLLAGIVFTRGLETSPVDLAYILAGGIIAIGVVLVLRRRAKHRRLLKQIGALAGRATTWVTELGADFSLGAGLGILLAAGIENWGGWVAFVVFFALAVEMISVGALFKQIDRDEKGIEIPSGASVPQETVEQLIDRVDSGFSALKVLSLWIWATALFAPAVLAFFLAVILSGDLSSHSGVITTADIALLTLIVVIMSLVVTMLTNVVGKQSTAWIINANFKRLRKDNPDPILYSLISMKAQAPQVKLHKVFDVSPELFTPEALLTGVYGRSTS